MRTLLNRPLHNVPSCPWLALNHYPSQNLTLTFKDKNGKEHTVTFASADGDFAATDTLVEISDDTFFGEIRGKCAEAGSVLDTAAGVTAKLTFSDGAVVTHSASIADA